MAKGKGTPSKPQKGGAPRRSLPNAKSPAKSPANAKQQSNPGISDELRQAIADLGGDQEDVDLIAGVDNDDADEEIVIAKTRGVKDDEKSLKAALGDFMKGLDFASLAPHGTVQQEDEEEDEEEEDDVSEPEEGASDEQDEEEEEEEEEAEEAEDTKAAVVEKAPKQAEPLAPVDTDPNSGSKIPAQPNWAALVPELAPLDKPLGKVSHSKLNNLRQRGEMLLESIPRPNCMDSSSDAAFISQILASGTHQDKLSALVLLVRESPIHAVNELERLRGMAGWRDGEVGSSGGRDQRLATIRAIADWWVTGGGKEAGKLRYFADQPLLAHPDVTDRHLVVYAFEDFLKKWFFNMLQILEVLSHDTLDYVRLKALDVAFQLLSGNAEQEQNLLRLGVNKLGDPDRAVASKASYHILHLLQVHPAMKAVVAREVSAIVLKTTLTGAAGSASSGTHVRFDDDDAKSDPKSKAEQIGHGRYYGLITLNQMTLTAKDRDVAGRLVEVYFEVFREILGDGSKKEEPLDKQEKMEKVTGKVEKWRGRRKGAKPKGGRKAAAENEELVEAGEAKLIAAVLTGVNRALPFAKIDDDLFAGYMETLFKICHSGTFNTSIQALQLVFQVCQSREAVTDRFYRTLYESLFDPRLLTSSKQAMYLNLLFKALKVDTSLPRTMAFVKRLLQMLGMHQPPFICGALYLLGELFEKTPGLRRMLIEPEDDGTEHFVDAPEDGSKPESSKAAIEASTSVSQYDGKKREPLYAHAETSCLWELTPFLNHFHPSVSLQANQLLNGQPLTGSPDISLNTLISFLDKFVYRNPKKTVQAKGASIMQPAAVNDTTGNVVRSRGPRSDESAFVNSEAFWRRKVEDVPADQLFFHKFFSAKLARKEALSKKKKTKDDDDAMDMGESADEEDGEDEDGEDVSDLEKKMGAKEFDMDDEEGDEEESDAEEAEIWRVMKATMPDAGDNMDLSEDSDSDEDDAQYDYSEDEGEEGEEGEDDDDEDSDEEGEEEEEEPAPKSKKGKGKAAEPESESDEEDDDDFPQFAEEDDDEDLIPLDEMDVVLGGSDEEAPEDEDEAAGAKRKRREDRKERRKKRREMPVFGSYEDYAALIEQDE